MNGFLTQGFSEEARHVAEASMEGRRRLLESTVIGLESVRDELWEVWNECRLAGWDGYSAEPVSQDTLRNAYTFLELLPIGCPPPSIGEDPDGSISLEWHRDKRHTLSVSIDGDANLYFSALLGPSKNCGSDIFFGEIPGQILQLIRRVAAL